MKIELSSQLTLCLAEQLAKEIYSRVVNMHLRVSW